MGSTAGPNSQPGWSRLRQFRQTGSLSVLVVLVVLVLVPLFFMVVASFRPEGMLPLEPGPFTISSYIEAYTGADFTPIIRDTLLYAGLGVLFALPIAFAFAFLTERTDMPLRNAMYVLMFIPMSTPVFATALGWVLLLGPRGGTINVYLRMLLGMEGGDGPFNIFSMTGLVFVHVLGIIPTMWLFLTAVLRQMDPALEEAASSSGASRWQVLRTVTAPLMRPGVAAVGIYFFITGLESLELPLALGPTAGIELLSTKIFFSLLPSADLGVNYGIPAAFGMLGLAMGILGSLIYIRMVRQTSQFAVITGKGYRPRLIPLGRWRYAALGAMGLFILVKVVLPFAILLYASFLRFYVPPVLEYAADMRWTLLHYTRLFDYRFFGSYFINTLIVAVEAATLTMLLVSFIGWLVVRRPSRLTDLINVVAFMPLAIPRGYLDPGAFSHVPRYATLRHADSPHPGIHSALSGLRYPADAFGHAATPSGAGRGLTCQRSRKPADILSHYAAFADSGLSQWLALGSGARRQRLLRRAIAGVRGQRAGGESYLRVLHRRALQ